MKLTPKTGLLILGSLIALLLPHSGLCFYSSSEGKWLSRDPIADPSLILGTGLNNGTIQAINAARLNSIEPFRAVSEERSLYGFVLNNPISHSDGLGLLSFDGCSEQQKMQITD